MRQFIKKYDLYLIILGALILIPTLNRAFWTLLAAIATN